MFLLTLLLFGYQGASLYDGKWQVVEKGMGYKVLERSWKDGMNAGLCPKCNTFNSNRNTCENCGTLFANFGTGLIKHECKVKISTSDPVLLAGIAKKSKREIVHKEVIKKLNDQHCLMDVFRSVASLRETVLEKLFDQGYLAEIAKNSEYNDAVRIAAIRKLRDTSTLIYLVKKYGGDFKYWGFMKAALENLDDPDTLRQVAEEGKYPEDRRTAAKKLVEHIKIREGEEGVANLVEKSASRDIRRYAISQLDEMKWQELFADIAKNGGDQEVQLEAINKLEPGKWQDLLIEIARTNKSAEIIIGAIEKIDDQKELAEFAKYLETDWLSVGKKVGNVIFKRITQQDLFVDLAENARHWYFRIEAIKMLDPNQWQELLAKIVKNDGSYREQREALKKLDPEKWQELILGVAKSSKSSHLMLSAIERIQNQDDLLDVVGSLDAGSHGNVLVIRLLIKKILDQNRLADIAKNARRLEFRLEACKKLANKNFQDLFTSLAKHDNAIEVRREAVRKLDPERWHDLLVQLAKNDSHYWVRKTIVKEVDKGKFQDLLIHVARNDKDYRVRRLAVEKLDKGQCQDLLYIIASNDENDSVRKAAIQKITDSANLKRVLKTEKDPILKKSILKRLDELPGK